jgi:putative FmdB family regulatory protein
MPIYSYKCKDGHVTDQMSSIAERKEPKKCKVCGEDSHMFIVAPQVQLDPTDPAFAGTWISWERKREKQMKQERLLERKRS